MVLAGINKNKLKDLGCHYQCFIQSPEVYQIAKKKKITRSMAAIEYASHIPGKKLFIIGNAPTAVYKILEMKKQSQLFFEAVIGVPVGFVSASKSKKALYQSDIPAITALGPKGGSNLAAALINAIIYNIDLI